MVSLSSLSQHVKHFPNEAGIHGCCIGPGGVNILMGSRNESLEALACRYIKPENDLLWTALYQGSAPK